MFFNQKYFSVNTIVILQIKYFQSILFILLINVSKQE
jgi:hypothetical protein